MTFAINCLALKGRQNTQLQAGRSSNEAELQKELQKEEENNKLTETLQHLIFLFFKKVQKVFQP